MPRGECCSTPGCNKPVAARGLCHGHYRKMKYPVEASTPCACGCGGLARKRFISGHNTRSLTPEEQSRRSAPTALQRGALWRGKGKKADGYVKEGGRHQHRVVAEKVLGRPLAPGEIAHHKNSVKRDNRPRNLKVMTQGQHINEHRAEMVKKRKKNT